jgi:hypothetical protein
MRAANSQEWRWSALGTAGWADHGSTVEAPEAQTPPAARLPGSAAWDDVGVLQVAIEEVAAHERLEGEEAVASPQARATASTTPPGTLRRRWLGCPCSRAVAGFGASPAGVSQDTLLRYSLISANLSP